VIRVVILSAAKLEDQLKDTLLFRRNVERIRASGVDEVKKAARSGRVNIILLDAALPGVAAAATALREDPLTRHISMAGLGRSELGPVQLALIEAGVNAILPLPPGSDWDDRLMRLVHVPARKATRFPVNFAVGVGRGQGEPFQGRILNLSVTGLFLQSSFPLEIAEDLRLAFELPEGCGQVRCTGTVVRLAPPEGVGVEFTSVEGEGRVRIKRYVESESAPRGPDPGL